MLLTGLCVLWKKRSRRTERTVLFPLPLLGAEVVEPAR